MNIRRISQAFIIGFLVLSWGCGKKENSALTVGVNPSQPLLIPVSQASSGGTTTGPTAPYFSLNSLKMTWAGSQQFQLLALSFYAGSVTSSSSSSNTAASFNCGGSGSSLTQGIFGTANVVDCNNKPPGGGSTPVPALDANFNLNIPAPTDPTCPNSVQSSAFYCDSLPITVSPNPFATYNIPVEVIVFGEALDNSGNATGRVTGIANITVQ